jgi:hypothetical protein
MARRKTTIKWQRKQPREAHAFRSVKLHHESPDGLSPLASWLDPSKPGEILIDLRDYQERWCDHVYRILCQVKNGEILKTVYNCTECGEIKAKERVVA